MYLDHLFIYTRKLHLYILSSPLIRLENIDRYKSKHMQYNPLFKFYSIFSLPSTPNTYKACSYFVPSMLLPWLSLAAAATDAATPVGWVVRYGSFRISAPVTPSASLRVAGLSAGNFEVASYKSSHTCSIRV